MARLKSSALSWGVSRSGYYAWQGREEPLHVAQDAALAVEIAAAYKLGRGAYGSPRVHRELRANGRRVSRKRVERLMKRDGLSAIRKKRFARRPIPITRTQSRPTCSLASSKETFPTRLGVTDVTFIWTLEGWLYLAVIIDLFSRRVVGWSASANQRLRTGSERAQASQRRASSGPRIHPPLRPWQRLRKPRLRARAHRTRSNQEHEPQGRLLRQLGPLRASLRPSNAS